MKPWRALAALLLLSCGSAGAADLRSDAETLLRRLAADPEAAYVVQSAKPAAITEEGDEVTIGIAGLAVAPRTNPKGGIAFGDVVIHVRRRADGGVEASADLPQRIALRDATAPATGQFGVGNGKLALGWGADLESDQVVLSADGVAEIGPDGQPGVTAVKPSLRFDRTAAKGTAGRFAFSIDEVRDPKGQTPVSVQGFGPFRIEGHYEDFPTEHYRTLLRHLMIWEQVRGPRGDPAVSLSGLEQGAALLEEARTRYAIDKMLLKFGTTTLQLEADIHFSLDSASGVSGSGTAWLSEAKEGAPSDNSNQAVALGRQMAQQFGAPGKAPDGSDARVFHVDLAPDGNAKLNGEPAPALAAGMTGAFKAFAQGWANRQADAVPESQKIPGATGCGVPVYPREALAAKEAGRTELTFDYDAQGKVTMTRIKTSGSPRLDEAARLAYITCKFPAGTSSAVIPVLWKIENGRGSASIGPGLTTTGK